MRRLAIPLVLVLAVPADARPARGREREALPPATFWRDLVEPRADEVAMLLRKAREVIREATDALESDLEWAGEERTRFFLDGYHLMRHARALSPENLDVLALLGEAADEVGKTREAVDALEAAIRITGPDRAAAPITARLGAIALRLGEHDRAVRLLRLAQGAGAEGAAVVHLAHALGARGEHTSAIEVLAGALPETRHSYSPELAMVAFALAVHYDRDEQRGAAYDTLDSLVRTLQQGFTSTIKNELAALRLTGPDLFYYRALLYEVLGQYVEARAEWAHYAAFPEAPWRARALGHIAEIDAQRRAQPGPRTPAVSGTVPPPIIRRRLPRAP